MTGLGKRLAEAVRRPDGRALLVTLVALAVLLPTWWLASRWYGERLLDQQRADAAIETSLRANALSSVINRRLARLQGLYAFVQVELSDEDFAPHFEKFASELYAGTRGIRSLTVAPGGVVRYVYPLAGNEGVVGYVPLDDPRPEMRSGVQRARDSREVALIGPIEPAQAGEGIHPVENQALIAHQAVYQGDTFWGLVTMVLDMPTMLEEAGLSEQPGELDFALRDNARVSYGSERVFESRPVLTTIQFPDDTWELAAAPLEGWQASVQGPLRVFQIGGLIIVGLLAGLVSLSVNRQAQLGQAVRQRTREIGLVNEQLRQDIADRLQAEAALSEREAQYRSIFESTSDGLLIFNLEGRLVDFNPAAAQMHGYSTQAFRDLPPERFIHPQSLPLFGRFIERVKAGREFRGRARDVRQDGTTFHIEVLGTGFTYRGQPHALAVVRDISEEVEAYQLLEQRVEERTQALATLLEASASIASTLELQPLLGLILEQLDQVVDYTAASVLFLEGDELRQAGSRGAASSEGSALWRFRREEAGRLGEALLGHEPLLVDDVQGELWLAQAVREAYQSRLDGDWTQVRSWMGVPLLVQERLTGWLILQHNQPNAYTSHHAALVQTIANQAATAIENARLYEQTRRLAVLEERQRLARELHDSVSQVLYGIGLGARTARTLLDRDPSLAAEPIEYVLSLADAGLAEMRALIFELRPDSLEKQGLVAALSRQAAALQARYKLKVRTEFCEEPSLPFEVKEALYRTTQEALNNIAKHAQARQVTIRLRQDGGAVALEVQDDGIGFDPQQDYPGHMGLHSMQERVTRMGGTLEIDSVPGRGSRVRVRIPAPEPPR